MSEELTPSEEALTVPTTAEFALLSAARSGRLRRFYYINTYTDAVISGVMGGGGKVESQRLMAMSELHHWLEPMPTSSTGFDAIWKLTNAGELARQRYLSRPKEPYRVKGKKP